MTSQQGGSFPYPITGIRTGYDPVKKRWPARKEIDEFMKDPQQAVLYFVALNIMQTRPLDHTLSYFQIAGIHGYPTRPWPRKGGPGRGSYCEHSNPNGRFITWHRVYLLLIEQALYEIIMLLVDPKTPNDISPIPVEQRPGWRQAAETWRLPYWDFALRRSYNQNSASLPQIALTETNPLADNSSSPNPAIPLPSIPFSAENPLFAFRYPLKQGEKLSDHGMTDMFDRGVRVLPLTMQTRTVRYAVAYRDGNAKIQDIWVKGVGDMNMLKQEFQNNTVDFRKNLRAVLKSTTTFAQFTMGTVKSGVARVPDLSNLHGNIHVTTGGWTGDGKNGNMSNVPAAAFDPIFFIFHACIDRISAMWEAAHSDKSNPNYWLPATDDQSPLVPFLDSTGKNYWVSKDTRDLNNLGYTYGVLAGIKDTATLADVCDNLYGDNGFFNGGAGGGTSRGFEPELPDIPPQAPDYIFTASYQPNEIGPLGIKIYLDYKGNSYPLGNIINFVNPPDAGCESCAEHREQGTIITSSTFISPALRDLYERQLLDINAFEAEEIEPLLAAALRWKLVALGDGSLEYPLEDLTSLKVGVSRRDKELRDEPRGPGAPRGGGDIPSFRSPTKVVAHVPLRGITAGKTAGLGNGEDFE